jgi:C4-type Zn-finger protein
VFKRLKNIFNTKKARLKKKKKKTRLLKKIKSVFKGPRSIKMAQKDFFGKSLKLKLLPESSF